MLERLAAIRSDMTEAKVARSTTACQRPCGASSFARFIYMRTRYTGLISAAFSVLLCAAAAFASPNKSIPISSGWLLQDAAQVPQGGEVISSATFQPAGWHPATVPGTVLTSLVNDGTYPEPLYGENNRPDRIPDTLCRTTWWYRTVFAPPAAGPDGRIWLNFDGINYLAEVWLNGHEVGTIKGAFTRGIFDVTSNLVAGASNILATRTRRPSPMAPDPMVALPAWTDPLSCAPSAGIGFPPSATAIAASGRMSPFPPADQSSWRTRLSPRTSRCRAPTPPT
jgi:hypothetical protein